jgi:caffeoyl-CoA O-methyltransferase
VIALDNMFQAGRVLDPTDYTPNTVAIRDLNESLPHDDRGEAVLLAIRDGAMLVRKR